MSIQSTPTLERNRQSTTTAPTTTPSTSESWTDRCQTQFDTQHTDPLENLMDDRNAVRLDTAYSAQPPPDATPDTR